MDKWLRNNNIIRVVAVLVGIMLWVIVRLDVQNSNGMSQPTTVSQQYTNVKIEVEGLDEDRYSLVSIQPERVTLTVIGTVAALRRVNVEDYRVVLDLSEALPGETLMSLGTVGFPNNVDVVLDPPNVTVVLDEKERKEVPVTINTVGSPEEGFTAGEPVSNPNRVNVTVTSRNADEVASVVGIVDLNGATETVKRDVKLVALNADGQELDVVISPAVVKVEVPVTRPFKTIPLQISLVGETPPGLAVGSFEQSVSEVTVYAPQSYLDTHDFYPGLTIDLSALNETKTFELEVPLHRGVERVLPDKVTATVTVVPAVKKTLEAVPITMNGKNANYDYRVTAPETNALDVHVEAALDVIANLAPNEVKAVIDVSNFSPGVYELPIDYSLPPFVDLAEDHAETVTVEITAKNAVPPAAPPAAPPAEGEEPAEAEAGENPADLPEANPPAEETAGAESPALEKAESGKQVTLRREDAFYNKDGLQGSADHQR